MITNHQNSKIFKMKINFSFGSRHLDPQTKKNNYKQAFDFVFYLLKTCLTSLLSYLQITKNSKFFLKTISGITHNQDIL